MQPTFEFNIDTVVVSVSENLTAQYNAIKMLASRVHLIAEYVKATQNGEVPFNHEIIREINALANRLPVLSSDKFKEEFYNVSNKDTFAYL